MKSFRAVFLLAGAAAVCASGQTTTPVFTTGQAARLIIGQKNFTYADYGATNQLIGSPGGISYANGVLWVADSNRLGSTPNNDRVLRFSDVSTYPSPTAVPDVVGSTCGACRGVASLVLGQPDFTTTNINLAANGLRNPTGVATDGTVLAVADTDNNRVLIWLTLPRGNGQPADVVIGQANFTTGGTSSPPTQTSLRGPEGVWIYNGRLFVADTQDNRVLIYNKIPTSNNAAADIVVGQANFTAFVQPDLTASQPSTAANNMQTPVSVSTDGTHLFVSDLGQNRVLIFNHIPTANGASADVAIGQPNLVTAVENNSFTLINTTLDADNNPENVTPVLCTTNGTDTDNFATYPSICAATLSFPRFVISDGTRLFVADGGNDRVLVYNTIPTVSGTRADIILGQPDEFSDNTGDNPDGANAFQTPTSMAWDGTNLYVSDGYNRRVVIFSQGLPNVPLDGIRNSASLYIYALANVTFSGSITAKDTLTITINGTAYNYTVVAADTLQTILQNLVKAINKAPDPNVIATADLSNLELDITARAPGAPGGLITLTTSVSASATEVLTASASTLNIYLEDPSKIAPGTIIVVNGTNLCDNTTSASMTGSYLPTSLNGCTLYADGVAQPLLQASPTQITAEMMQETQDRTSTSLYVRSQHANGTVTVTSNVAATIVFQNPGIYGLSGNDPRRGIVYHGTSSAFNLIDVDGTIQAGDIGTLMIGNATYNYTVNASDALSNVRDGLIAAINNAPDPTVYAYATNEFTRLALVSLVPGPQGEGTAVTATVSTATTNTAGALLLLTAYNATMCCSNIEGALVTQNNPAVPGEMVYVLATGLGVTSPETVNTGQIYQGGSALNPLAVQVDSILTGGTTANPVSVGLVPGTVGVYYVQFLLNSGLASNQSTQTTIAQQAFVSNVITFPVAVPGLATTLIVTPTPPTTVTPGTAVSFTVTALDYTGAPATSYTGTVAITSTDGAATLPTSFSLASGTGTFSVTLNTLGEQTVTATDTTTSSLTGTSPGIFVTATGHSRIGAAPAVRVRPGVVKAPGIQKEPGLVR